MAEKIPLITDMEIAASLSEDHGIEALSTSDHQIYSVGISTGGIAEMRMVLQSPDRHVTATTIDPEGLAYARRVIEQNNLSNRIDAILENVADVPLPHPDNTFDFIYARLVLHYLPKTDLISALGEMHRILKPGGRIFVVVRSTESHDMKRNNAITDPETMLTTYTFTDSSNNREKTVRRYFHNKESLRRYMEAAGFQVDYVDNYREQIYIDFMRTQLASEPDEILELLATK